MPVTVSDIKSSRVGVFQGVGLSSLALGVWLGEHDVTAVHYLADIGQSSRQELDAAADALRAAGFDVRVVDLRADMAGMGETLLRCQARHDGGYWNTTGAARYVLTACLLPRMLADGCDAVAHGCVGNGNDQRRFAGYGQRFAPGVPVYAPWIDPDATLRFPDRAAMVAAVEQHQLPLDRGSSAVCSTDANLTGASHESDVLEDLDSSVDRLRPRWSLWPHKAPPDPAEVTVRIRGGRIVDVAGSGPDPAEWLDTANILGARHGIWLRDVVERRVIGTVCRGVYEAPGLELLGVAWSWALANCLDAPATALYRSLASAMGEAVYEGRHLDQSSRAAQVAINTLLETIDIDVTVDIGPGTARPRGGGHQAGVMRETRFSNGGHRWH